MVTSIQEKNKALVLEAFDMLFNRRDYTAAERFWSPNYIQHSAHIAPGREGLFNLVKSLPPTLKYEPGLIVAEVVPRGTIRTVVLANSSPLAFTEIRSPISPGQILQSLAFFGHN